MTTNDQRRPFGQQGEKLASDHLQSRGYAIIETNWRCQHGEIDIIAHNDSAYVFVEVRSRHAETTEASFESITPRKRAKLTALAHAYLAAHNLENANWRVDVIAIALPRVGHPIIEHVEDALDW